MLEIELQGIVEYEYRDFEFEHIYLKDPNTGLKVDLIYRFDELKQSFPNRKLGVYAYVSGTDKKSKDEMIEGFLNKMEIGYEKEYYKYSEYTSGTDWNSNLDIEGHNLFNEFRIYEGKFMILTLEIFDSE
jgi:hypothetical protein